MINFLTLSLKCKKLKLILSILFLLSFCFTKSQKETLTINIPKNIKSIRTGYPVYNITANTDGSKLYFYNKLNAYNTGLYIYDKDNETTININQDSNTDNDIDTTIGDCIYNPYKNHFLISQNGDFGDDPAIIKVIRADLNNSYVTNIFLTDNGVNTQYPKRMFIAPNEKLYVMANMHYFPDPNPNMVPKVFVYNANDDDESIYTLIQTHVLTMPYYNDKFDYYSAHFCYNPHNQLVYATIHPTEITLDPYQTVPNSMFDFNPPIDIDVNGLLIKFEDNQITPYQLLYPGKIICPDIGDPEITSQYDNKLFIIGKRFYVYDYSINQFQPPDGYNEPFNDITYSAFYDKLFAIKDMEDECSADRKCGIYSIDYNANNQIVFTNISEDNDMYIDGQTSSIFSNPYDANVYIYNKFDDEKLGGTEVKLFYFDPCSTIFSLLSHNLGITSYYPELDHCPDYGYRFYNITTPYIDPYNNYIYVPNGGHSCVSRITFEPNEPLLLRSGWTWLSFPRLENRDYVGKVPAATVLNNNILPQNFNEKGELRNLPPQTAAGSENEITRVYNPQDEVWVPGPRPLEDIWSTRGYKIELLPEEVRHIYLQGTILLPDETLAEMNLYAGLPNWIGYFLPYTMRVGDAFASIWDNISEIRHQDWAIANPSGNQPPVPDYMLNFTLSYGDMVIVKVFDDCTFYWPSNSNPETPLSAPETNYFSYEEKADYTPFYVEMNPDSIPVEIAVYEDTTCVGAAVVQDSIVEINAYLTDSLGYNPEISFISHYGLKAAGKTVKKYSVYNFKTNRMESRIIHSKEKADYYYISLKGGKITNETDSNPVSISCAPNPLKNEVKIKFTVQQECMLQIGVYDLYGKSLNILQKSVSKAGTYSINWTGTDSNGKPLPNGVYILKLKAGTNYAQTKIIIMK